MKTSAGIALSVAASMALAVCGGTKDATQGGDGDGTVQQAQATPLGDLPTEVQPVGGPGGRLQWLSEAYQPNSTAPSADNKVYLSPKLLGSIGSFSASTDGAAWADVKKARITMEAVTLEPVVIEIANDAGTFAWTVTCGGKGYAVAACGGPDHKCGPSGIPKWFGGTKALMEVDFDGSGKYTTVERLVLRGM